MKLVLAVLNKDDTKSVIQELMRGGFSVTKLSSAGGFLRAGTTTILCGMKDERVEKALEIIKTYSCKKESPMRPNRYSIWTRAIPDRARLSWAAPACSCSI